MGCATSKEKLCRHCESAISPISRSYSMHVHHPPQTKGDSYHVVALTSSTLGSLNCPENRVIANGCDDTNENMIEHENKDFSVGLIEAKTWSNMIEAKIPKVVPKTPTRTPPGEPETINTWELMEGLEDMSPLRSPAHRLRSFSFDVVRDPCPRPISPSDRQKSRFQENGNSPPKPQPMWLQMSDDNDQVKSNSLIADFDPDVISAFRKSLSEIKSEEDPFDLEHLVVSKEPAWACNDVLEAQDKGRDRVVLYFTSLRGVRKTYEDCCHVRVILKGIGIRVDERDVSMHSGFKEELRELLKDRYNVAPLPRVFVGNKYVGGADEIRQLHEDGKLEKLLDSCEKLDGGCGGGDGGGVCDACGDIRFVPCATCSGSCKIYYEDIDRNDEEEEEEEEAEEGESGFQRCPDCNENGLIRCPICCY